MQSYVYGSANRLQTLASPAGTFTYFYNPGLAGTTSSSSLVAKIALPNGAFITNTYDDNARMLGTWLKNSGATNLDSGVYTYNVGNQRIVEDRASLGHVNEVDYGYDPIGQLTSDSAVDLAMAAPPTNRLNEQLYYGYDPAGNLAFRTNNALVQNFAVNSLNELTSNETSGTLTVMGTTTSKATNVTVNSSNALLYNAATNMPLTTTYTAIAQDSYGRSATNSVTVNLATNVTFQYDVNGNLINDGLRNFTYDDENQMIQVWVPDQWFSQFGYDGKMRRRIRQEFTWQGGAWVQTNEVYYVYDGNLVIQERDINNLPTTTYTRGLDLSGSLQGAGGIGGLLARTAQSYVDAPMAGHAFYHTDGNGNITMLINSSQAIVAKYLYDAFGNVLSKSGLLADANVYQFSSKEKDLNSGMVYYLYRYYDPNLQRWPNRDPLGEPGFDLARTLQFSLGSTWSDIQIQRHKELLARLGFISLNLAGSPLLGDGPNKYAFERNDPLLFIDPDGRTAAGCLSSLAWCVGGTMLAFPACNPFTGWLTCGGTILAGPVAGCLSAYDACNQYCAANPSLPGTMGKDPTTGQPIIGVTF